jgi:hypothetical protein
MITSSTPFLNKHHACQILKELKFSELIFEKCSYAKFHVISPSVIRVVVITMTDMSDLMIMETRLKLIHFSNVFSLTLR